MPWVDRKLWEILRQKIMLGIWLTEGGVPLQFAAEPFAIVMSCLWDPHEVTSGGSWLQTSVYFAWL